MANQNQQYFLRSNSTDGRINRGSILLTHSTTLPALSRTTSLVAANNFVRAASFRRTAESARQICDNFNSVIREIRPLVQNARTVNISSFLNRPQSEPNIQNSASGSTTSPATPVNVIINIEDEPASSSNNNNNNNAEQAIEAEHNGNNENTENEEISHNIEAQQALGILQKYIPFLLILLAKCLYDHQEGILNLIVLFAVFTHTNSILKREVIQRGRRNLTKLFITALYITLGILFIHYIFEEEKLYMNLIFIRTYEKPLTAWDLLWFVAVTDFILKLITIIVKILVTMLPSALLPFQKRGKIYLFIESVSQLYRGLATIQPWLYYLLESYQGTEKIVGVFLAAAYMVSKGADLMEKLRLLKTAILKLLQNVTVGSSPDKDQIQSAGDHCPICHDEYESPVLLQCRHIFCESCVTTWFDREQTCPLCRSKIVDDPSWRDGSTSFFIQLF